MSSSQQPQYKWSECDRCKKAGFPMQQIRFEKIGEDPATGKIKWKLIDKETNGEHVHKGQVPRRRPRVGEIIYQGDDVEEANKLLRNKDYELFAALPNFTTGKPVIYVIVKREFV